MLNSADYTAIKLLLKIGYPKLDSPLDDSQSRQTVNKALPTEGLVLVYRRTETCLDAVSKLVFSTTTPYLIGDGLKLESY